jgi:hypothetical protein
MEFSALSSIRGTEPAQQETGFEKTTPGPENAGTRFSTKNQQIDGNTAADKKKIQQNNSKTEIAKQLLRKLPDEKAYIVYSSLARLRVTQHPTEAILSEVTSKLGKEL